MPNECFKWKSLRTIVTAVSSTSGHKFDWMCAFNSPSSLSSSSFSSSFFAIIVPTPNYFNWLCVIMHRLYWSLKYMYFRLASKITSSWHCVSLFVTRICPFCSLTFIYSGTRTKGKTNSSEGIRTETQRHTTCTRRKESENRPLPIKTTA